jgi:hypothetical protein
MNRNLIHFSKKKKIIKKKLINNNFILIILSKIFEFIIIHGIFKELTKIGKTTLKQSKNPNIYPFDQIFLRKIFFRGVRDVVSTTLSPHITLLIIPILHPAYTRVFITKRYPITLS